LYLFNDRPINNRHASRARWLQDNYRNSSETINGLQIRLNHELPCLGRDVGGLSQAPSKTQINHRTQRSLLGVIWDSLPQVTVAV